MPLQLDDSSPDFERRFNALVETKREETVDVGADVRSIIERVASEGDDALIDLTERFDRHRLKPGRLRLPEERIEAAFDGCDPELLDALQNAAARIAAFHERQRPDDIAYTDDLGVKLGQRWSPIDAVGLYVPGGKAAYPSSVLMNALPAKVAGVERLAIVVPAPDGEVAPLVLVAAKLAGIDEIYPIGGAQAVAALALGTESIRPVDKIVGPGNAYVAEAKRQVFGRVGIDMIAGPSEVVVVAEEGNDPAWIAADLLSQAEHDEMAQAILITDSLALAAAVQRGSAGPARKPAQESHRQCQLGGARRPRRDLFDGEGTRPREPPGAGASGTDGGRSRGHVKKNSACRLDFPGRPYARSYRRLCRRSQSRSPDQPHRPFRIRPLGLRLHEANHASWL